MTTRPPNSPDALFNGFPLNNSIDEEGVMENVSNKMVVSDLADAGIDVPSRDSKQLAEGLDSFQPSAYHRLQSEKRLRESLNV